LDLLSSDLTRPWWRPSSGPHDDIQSTFNPPSDDNDTSTPRFMRLRTQSHNYAFRNNPIAARCPSILPLHLLVPHYDSSELGFGPGQAAEGQKGWYCTACGKLNRVIMMRHRRCTSSACTSKGKTAWGEGGYSVPLDSIRNPHQTLPIYLPNNTLPFGVDEPTVTTWPDGMLVLWYCLSASAAGQTPQQEVSARHIFTCNAPSLQVEATELLDNIQSGCELVRDNKDGLFLVQRNL
jgi:hypothetical protein